MLLISIDAIFQAVTTEPQWFAVAIFVALVGVKILEVAFGPIIRRMVGDDVPTQLLKELVGLQKQTVRDTGALIGLAEDNAKWHDEKDPESGLSRAYFPSQRMFTQLDDHTARLRRIEHSRGVTTSGEDEL